MPAPRTRRGTGCRDAPRTGPAAASWGAKLDAELRRRVAVQKAELEREAARYRDLFEFAPVGYVELDAEATIRNVNLTASTLLGVPRGALVHRAFPSFILPADQDLFHRSFRQCLSRETAQSFELRLVRRGQDNIRVRVSIDPVRDSGRGWCRLLLIDISAESRLRESESARALEIRSALDYARCIVDTTSVALTVLDTLFTTLSANAAFQEMFRVGEDELLGKPFALPGHDDEETRGLKERLRRLLRRDKAIQDIAVERTGPDGERRHYRMDARLMRRIDHRDLVLLSFQDVTAQHHADEELRRSRDRLEERVQERTAELTRVNRKLRLTVQRLARSERHLRESNDQFRLAMSHLPALAYLKDEKGRIIFVNEYSESVLGTPRAACVGRPDFPFWPPEVNADLGRREKRVARTGKSEEFVQEVRLGQRSHSYQAVLFAIPRDKGPWIGGIWTDITESRSGMRRAAYLTAAMDQVPEAVLICGANGEVLYVNSAFQGYLGEGGRFVGEERFAAMLSDSADEPLRREVEDAFRTGRERELRLEKDADGQIREWIALVMPVKDDRDRIGQVIVLLRETTERTLMERHLRRKQKTEALGALAGGIAHDFNNLLIPIIINTELALHHLPEHGEIRHYLNQSLTAAERGKQLIKQIVMMCREEEKNLEPVRVAQVVRETIELLRASFPSTIDIRLREEARSDLVLGDPGLLHQVILNLGNNAAQAMQETGGAIDVELADVRLGPQDAVQVHPDLPPGNYLRLSVKDTGPGIPEDLLDRIFDPFFTTKGAGKGSGMGLAIVHGIVRTLKGAITVRSRPREGTRFDIHLPLVDEAAAGRRSDALGTLPRGTERILVVDDEEIVVRAEKTMLRHLGYHVTTARDSQEALDLFRSRPGDFDAVITDQGMPRLKGDELARELLKIRADLPIVLCTGYDDAVNAESAAAMGIKGFLMKPFSIRELAETIRQAVDPTPRRA